jgi:hypothetical protein
MFLSRNLPAAGASGVRVTTTSPPLDAPAGAYLAPLHFDMLEFKGRVPLSRLNKCRGSAY